MRLHQSGRLTEAEDLYRGILQAHPGHAGAWQLLGVIAHQRGRHEAAAELIGRAVELAPGYAEAHLNLGTVLEVLGRAEAAEASFRRAVALRPDYAQAHFNLGAALRSQGRLEEAVSCFRRALDLRPDHVEALGNLGAALHLLERPAEAETCLRRAVALRPDHAESWANLGAVLEAANRLEESAGCLRRAVALRPDRADAHYNLGNTLVREGDAAGAAAAFRRATALDPAAAKAGFNLGLLRLGQGDPAAGWALYDRRLDDPSIQARRRPPVPEWRGEPLAGRRLLVWREQGLGDELMFASCYADLLARADGPVIVECDPRLVSLFARSFPQATVRAETADGARPTPAPEIDRHVAAGSLPRRLRPDLTRFPARPWLVADPERGAAWRERLDALGPGLKVGIGWRSGLATGRRLGSYTRLDAWEPVLSVPGIVFANLQYDDCEAEIVQAERRFGVAIARWPDLDLKNDLEGAAALTAGLDLVITAATSVGEMAAALGVPTWRFAGPGDWTVLGTTVRPWFPSQRTFLARPGEPLGDMPARLGTALRAAVSVLPASGPSPVSPQRF